MENYKTFCNKSTTKILLNIKQIKYKNLKSLSIKTEKTLKNVIIPFIYMENFVM